MRKAASVTGILLLVGCKPENNLGELTLDTDVDCVGVGNEDVERTTVQSIVDPIGWGGFGCSLHLGSGVLYIFSEAESVREVCVTGPVEPPEASVRVFGQTGAYTGNDANPRGPDMATGVAGSRFEACELDPVDLLGLTSPKDWVNLGVEFEVEEGADCWTWAPMTVCLTTALPLALRRAPQSSTCTPGSGTFALVPGLVYDKDGDGRRSGVLWPIQLTGSGRMTSAAWLTSINITQNYDAALSIPVSGTQFAFDATDHVDVGGQSLVALSESPLELSPETVQGNPPILFTEAVASTRMPLSASMSWTCGSVSGEESVATLQGYSARLADVGCALPQRMTLRPTSQGTLQVELYGTTHTLRELQLGAPDLNGYRPFVHSDGGLLVAGRLGSYDPQNGAELILESVTDHGQALCQPGTYILPAEN